MSDKLIINCRSSQYLVYFCVKYNAKNNVNFVFVSYHNNNNIVLMKWDTAQDKYNTKGKIMSSYYIETMLFTDIWIISNNAAKISVCLDF